MGYSTSNESGNTLDLLENLCRTQNKSGNKWNYKGKQYFFEIDRKDQPDGGIKGSVALCVGENSASDAGRFHIDGDGIILKFPGWPTDLIPKPVKMVNPFRW